MTVVQIPQPEQVEQMTANVKRYRFFDGQAVVHEVTGFSRSIVNEWVEVVADTLAKWPKDKPIIIIHLLQDTTLSPYARQKAVELAASYPEAFGNSIVVVGRSLHGRVLELFVRFFPNRAQPGMKRHICFSVEQAVEIAQRVLDER